jgi:hypothetical protein
MKLLSVGRGEDIFVGLQTLVASLFIIPYRILVTTRTHIFILKIEFPFSKDHIKLHG